VKIENPSRLHRYFYKRFEKRFSTLAFKTFLSSTVLVHT